MLKFILAALVGLPRADCLSIAVIDTGISDFAICMNTSLCPELCNMPCRASSKECDMPYFQALAAQISHYRSWATCSLTNRSQHARLCGDMRADCLYDSHGHGTFVSSVLSDRASTASILALKAFDGDGASKPQWIVSAIEYSCISGAHVILLSSGAIEDQGGPVSEAIRNALLYGITVVASAGNEGPTRGTILSPANIQGVVSVAALSGSSQLINRKNWPRYRPVDRKVSGHALAHSRLRHRQSNYPSDKAHQRHDGRTVDNCFFSVAPFSSTGPVISHRGFGGPMVPGVHSWRHVPSVAVPGMHIPGLNLKGFPSMRSGTSVAAPLFAAMLSNGGVSAMKALQRYVSHQSSVKVHSKLYMVPPRSMMHWIQAIAVDFITDLSSKPVDCNLHSLDWWDMIQRDWSNKWQYIYLQASAQPLAGELTPHPWCAAGLVERNTFDFSKTIRASTGDRIGMMTYYEQLWLSSLELGESCDVETGTLGGFTCHMPLYQTAAPIAFNISMLGSRSLVTTIIPNVSSARWEPKACWIFEFGSWTKCHKAMQALISSYIVVRLALRARLASFSSSAPVRIEVHTNSPSETSLPPAVIVGTIFINIVVQHRYRFASVLALEEMLQCPTHAGFGDNFSPTEANSVHVSWELSTDQEDRTLTSFVLSNSSNHYRETDLSKVSVEVRFRHHSVRPSYRQRAAYDSFHHASYPSARANRDDLSSSEEQMDSLGDSLMTNFHELRTLAARNGILLDSIETPWTEVRPSTYGTLIVADIELEHSVEERSKIWLEIGPIQNRSFGAWNVSYSDTSAAVQPMSLVVLSEWDDARLHPGPPKWDSTSEKWWTYDFAGSSIQSVNYLLSPVGIYYLARATSGLARLPARVCNDDAIRRVPLPQCDAPLLAEIRSGSPLGMVPSGSQLLFAWLQDDIVSQRAAGEPNQNQVAGDTIPFGRSGCYEHQECSRWGAILAALDPQAAAAARYTTCMSLSGSDSTLRCQELYQSPQSSYPAVGRVVAFSDTGCIDAAYRAPPSYDSSNRETILPEHISSKSSIRPVCRGLMQRLLLFAAFGKELGGIVSPPIDIMYADPLFVSEAQTYRSNAYPNVTPDGALDSQVWLGPGYAIGLHQCANLKKPAASNVGDRLKSTQGCSYAPIQADTRLRLSDLLAYAYLPSFYSLDLSDVQLSTVSNFTKVCLG